MDLIGPYTLRGKEKSEIDFMCLTMIDPASSWFEIVELPVADLVPNESVNKKDRKTKEAYFDKSSFMISHLVNDQGLEPRLLLYSILVQLGFESLLDAPLHVLLL